MKTKLLIITLGTLLIGCIQEEFALFQPDENGIVWEDMFTYTGVTFDKTLTKADVIVRFTHKYEELPAHIKDQIEDIAVYRNKEEIAHISLVVKFFKDKDQRRGDENCYEFAFATKSGGEFPRNSPFCTLVK